MPTILRVMICVVIAQAITISHHTCSSYRASKRSDEQRHAYLAGLNAHSDTILVGGRRMTQEQFIAHIIRPVAPQPHPRPMQMAPPQHNLSQQIADAQARTREAQAHAKAAEQAQKAQERALARTQQVLAQAEEVAAQLALVLAHTHTSNQTHAPEPPQNLPEKLSTQTPVLDDQKDDDEEWVIT